MLAALVALVASAGCGSSSSGGTHPTSPSTAATASSSTSQIHATAPSTTTQSANLPAAVIGRWARVFTTKEWAHAGGYPAGTWTINVDQHGQVSVFLPLTTAPDFTTTFQVTGANLSIGKVPICPPAPTRYRWSATPTALTITLVSDTCAARAVLFGETWQRRR
jgi:hypothetical protein